MARLRGRAVHAADGHHLRAAGLRAGAGLPDRRAERTQPGAGQGDQRTSLPCRTRCRWNRARPLRCNCRYRSLSQQLADRTADRDKLTQALAAANVTIQSVTEASTRLQGQLKDVTARADTTTAELQTRVSNWQTRRADTSAADLQAARQQLADMQQQIAQLDRTVSSRQGHVAGETVRPGEAGRSRRARWPLCATSWKARRRMPRRARRPKQQTRQAVEIAAGR